MCLSYILSLLSYMFSLSNEIDFFLQVYFYKKEGRHVSSNVPNRQWINVGQVESKVTLLRNPTGSISRYASRIFYIEQIFLKEISRGFVE